MSKRYAIDIALLPPLEIMDLAIKVNHDNPSTYSLNTVDRMPHITLMQAVLKEDDLNLAESLLHSVASKFRPLELSASLGHTSLPGFGSKQSKSSYFNIEPNERLQKLHEELMKSFEGLVSFDAKNEDFCDDDIRQASLDWVQNFVRDAAFDKFWPHITLMTATDEHFDIPDFSADRIALCHMGDFNTCRIVLAEAKLSLT